MIGTLGAISFGLMAGPCSGYWVIRVSMGAVSAIRMATTRAPCVTLPAPTLTSRSAFASFAARAARTTASSVVSLSISSKTPAQAAPRIARIRAIRPRLRDTVRPQTMNARFAPWRLSSAGSCSRASSPLYRRSGYETARKSYW